MRLHASDLVYPWLDGDGLAGTGRAPQILDDAAAEVGILDNGDIGLEQFVDCFDAMTKIGRSACGGALPTTNLIQ